MSPDSTMEPSCTGNPKISRPDATASGVVTTMWLAHAPILLGVWLLAKLEAAPREGCGRALAADG